MKRANQIHCDIVSAEAEIFSDAVKMVIAHGVLGDLGITPGHTPLLTTLKPGPVRLVRFRWSRRYFLYFWWIFRDPTESS